MKEARLKELPAFSKPRERAIDVGVNNLADYELLAIILGTGSKDSDVLELAKQLLIEVGSVSSLYDLTIEELKQFHGIGNAKAITILSAIELGKRAMLNICDLKKVKSLKDIYNFSFNIIGSEKQEILLAIFIDSQSKIIGKKIVSIGSLNSTVFHLRDVIKWALKASAYALIIAHNHPSGDSLPSSDDIESTKDLISACKAVDLNFIDHLIIGKNSFYSFANNKCFKV